MEFLLENGNAGILFVFASRYIPVAKEVVVMSWTGLVCTFMVHSHFCIYVLLFMVFGDLL